MTPERQKAMNDANRVASLVSIDWPAIKNMSTQFIAAESELSTQREKVAELEKDRDEHLAARKKLSEVLAESVQNTDQALNERDAAEAEAKRYREAIENAVSETYSLWAGTIPPENSDATLLQINTNLARALADPPAKPEEHPETICQDCHGPNIVWFVDNETWNRVMGGDGGIICPVCFVKRAESVGISDAWHLTPENSPMSVAGESASLSNRKTDTNGGATAMPSICNTAPVTDTPNSKAPCKTCGGMERFSQCGSMSPVGFEYKGSTQYAACVLVADHTGKHCASEAYGKFEWPRRDNEMSMRYQAACPACQPDNPTVAEPATQPQVEREWRVRNKHGVLYATGAQTESVAREWVDQNSSETLVFSDDGGKTWVDAETGG